MFPSPEKVIHKRLVALARTVSSSANESDLTRLAAARSVAGFFAANVELNVDLPELGQRNSMDREEITQAALLARSRAGGLEVNLSDINVTVAPDHTVCRGGSHCRSEPYRRTGFPLAGNEIHPAKDGRPMADCPGRNGPLPVLNVPARQFSPAILNFEPARSSFIVTA